MQARQGKQTRTWQGAADVGEYYRGEYGHDQEKIEVLVPFTTHQTVRYFKY